MFLLLYNIGFPNSTVFWFIFSLLTFPIYGGYGIYSFIQKDYKKSTLVLSLLVFLLLFLVSFLICPLENLENKFLYYFTIPFGFFWTTIFLMFDLSYVAYLIGIVFNIFAIFGVVRFIERIIKRQAN